MCVLPGTPELKSLAGFNSLENKLVHERCTEGTTASTLGSMLGGTHGFQQHLHQRAHSTLLNEGPLIPLLYMLQTLAIVIPILFFCGYGIYVFTDILV